METLEHKAKQELEDRQGKQDQPVSVEQMKIRVIWVTREVEARLDQEDGQALMVLMVLTEFATSDVVVEIFLVASGFSVN